MKHRSSALTRKAARQPKVKRADVAIIGWSCRLPGAASPDELWELVAAGRCAVTQIPDDRWLLERFGHPGQAVRGRSYTWAAGIIEDVFGFDPAVFGISPREAEQMDPQQRLLLELTWEALEDAGIPPSHAAGTPTGVYIGGSALDYGNLRLHDPAAADQYFATGNTLSNLANRISYIFDLQGPSCTIDTACSSSLVALDAAIAAIQSGKIDTAIVGGVSLFCSPFGFIGFSQAGMLSPTGLCRSFAAKADGYVRAEGLVVFVLRAKDAAISNDDRIHGLITGSGVNSDGRTNGISLPSLALQRALLTKVYSETEVDPESLAFIEAHGTGTRVGDPIEATALGEALGKRRAAPLPIGSIKTNIGHTEPVSGLAGVLKAMLALKHDALPPTLHCDEFNPDIPFSELNLIVSTQAIPLKRSQGARFAGISSFGFGGTNAHVIICDPPLRPAAPGPGAKPKFLLLSARSQAALAALAGLYAHRLETASSQEAAQIVAAAAYRREALPERLVAAAASKAALIAALNNATDVKRAADEYARGTSIGRGTPVTFAYSGNASQWAGMNRDAYESNATFRTWFDKIDALFAELSGWSLVKTTFGSGLDTLLQETRIAQPLIFANQVATTHCLAELGLLPAMVLGHSIGEVAAAEAAGILDLKTAIRVIYFRSENQEPTRDTGDMAVVFGTRKAVLDMIDQIPGLEIAAHNSTRCFTLSGPNEALAALGKLGKSHKLRVRWLDLHYPFHSELMSAVKNPLLADLARLDAKPGRTIFISTVDNQVMSGPELDASYWWRNIREPVLFMEAVQQAAELGSRIFVEIGPSPTLITHINDTADHLATAINSFAVHERETARKDVFQSAVSQVIACGGEVDMKRAFGSDPGPNCRLPAYPWQHKTFRLADSVESTGLISARPWHPLIGARTSSDATEWLMILDLAILPALADHRVGGQILLPAAAFAEMAVAVARDWLAAEHVGVSDLEILHQMTLTGNMSREVLCRVTAATGTLDIMSRPRLIKTSWLLHARAKILQKPASISVDSSPPPADAMSIAGPVLYAAARRSGLQFGPGFQHLAKAARLDERRIRVDLLPAVADARYGLNPARLDSCFHGLILLFSHLSAGKQAISATAYLPVRVGEIRLHKPGAVIDHAMISVKRHSNSAIVANFDLFDAEGELIAVLTDARYQATQSRTNTDLSSLTFVQTSYRAAGPMAESDEHQYSAKQVSEILIAEPSLDAATTLPPDVMLLEGWATDIAYRLALSLAENDKIDLASAVGAGRLPVKQRPLLENLLSALVHSGLLEATGQDTFFVTERISLPDPNAVLKELAVEYPGRAPELLLAARTGAMLSPETANGFNFHPLSDSSVEAFEFGSISVSAAAHHIIDCLERLTANLPRSRSLRILQIGYGPLSPLLVKYAHAQGAHLCLLEPDGQRLERAHLAFPNFPLIEFVENIESLSNHSFDLVVAAETLHRLVPGKISLPQIAEKLASQAVIIAIEPAPSLFRDLVFGLRTEWLQDSGRSAARTAGAWAAELTEAGFQNVATSMLATQAGPAIALTGQASNSASAPCHAGPVMVICDHQETSATLAGALAQAFKSLGIECDITSDENLGRIAVERNQSVIVLSGAFGSGGDAVDDLVERCLAFKALALRFAKDKLRLFIPCPGATRGSPRHDFGRQAAFWSFTRTLANELPDLDIRRIDVEPELSADVAARHIARIAVSDSAETDLVLNETETRLLRLQPFDAAPAADRQPNASAARLKKGLGSGLDRIHWMPEARVPPSPGEVEIAVVATGLNFRDVMWGLSILSDEMLEDGFAGPTLGLECAGRVVRVGAAVTELRPGDNVVAFARGSFATHVTVDADLVAVLPPHLSLEAAATIPVAFLTAYYALITCAQLAKDEWVLIHGGAGGVGLAALQIARWRVARVIATAGSIEKRDLVMALGAEHVFDSRSGSFVDDVRRVTQDRGVSVVLNSLSGEAMERSLGLLQPFGRFVELGKRDYLANTQLGLRPFRQNLTYFGVDLDQLLLAQPRRARELFIELMMLFHGGELSALPYRSFEARDFVDAMRLMQRSGHIGKILIKPPVEGEIKCAAPPDFVVAADKTHLITGGFSGFGLETALWLADHGARHIVLIGRNGASTPAAQAALAALASRGIAVRAAALDIADAVGLGRLLDSLDQTMPPIAGVIHAAMVLDDAIIPNLDAKNLANVLRPKITGAENLDRLLGDRALDYFVLFSSATTMIGNPGQGAYVAANGFLEGLARARVAAGRPALAIAWGAIADVGVLARSKDLQETLATRAGVKAIDAHAALDLMGRALAHKPRTLEDAVLIVTDMNWATARKHLPLLNSPTYKTLMKEEQAAEAERHEIIDLGALAALPPDLARQKLAALIVEEIAHILRMPAQDVDRVRPLAEIGLDSLMAVELAMTLESRFNMETSLTTSASTLNILELADHVLAMAADLDTEETAVAKGLAQRHLGQNAANELASLSDLLHQRSQSLGRVL